MLPRQQMQITSYQYTHMSITTNKWDKEKQKGISTWKPKGETDVVL